MYSGSDLTGDIKNLETKIVNETHELQAKETEERTKEAELEKLKQERDKLKRELEEIDRKIAADNAGIPKIKSEIEHLKHDQQTKHAELQRVHDAYTKALQESQVKIKTTH